MSEEEEGDDEGGKKVSQIVNESEKAMVHLSALWWSRRILPDTGDENGRTENV